MSLRQHDLGSRLIERVIGNVPVRHAVLCFPPHLRFTLGYDPALVTGGFSALANAMFDYQRRKAHELFGISIDLVHSGCVVVIHPVSANLEPNYHFHGAFPDGAFLELDGRLEFRRLPAPTAEDIAGVAHAATLAFCKALAAKGFWEMTSTSSDTVEGILTLPKQCARPAMFYGQAARNAEGGVAPRDDGAYAFHLFLSKAIELEERPQLDRLINYVLAPPFSDDQLEVNAAGNIVLRLKRPRHDGTTHEVLTPFELLDRLANLVPRRNTNSVRYLGIYGARARLRAQAVALRLGSPPPIGQSDPASMLCPICNKPLRMIAVVRGALAPTDGIPPDTPSPNLVGREDWEDVFKQGTGGTFREARA